MQLKKCKKKIEKQKTQHVVNMHLKLRTKKKTFYESWRMQRTN